MAATRSAVRAARPPALASQVQNVTLRKEGPIHDVQWSPKGDEFAVSFGVSPPETCLFNVKCEVTHSFGEAPRNTISWSPHARFLVLAGFGNMSGELSFYDRATLRCLSTVDAHMTVNYGWSPDSRYFLTAILFPRLRVDNGYRVWSCAGGLLHEEKIEELTIAHWRPQPASLFSPPTEADIHAHPAAARGPAPTSMATKYVPPGQRSAAGGGRSLSELAAAHGGGGPGFGEGGAGAGRSLSSLAALQASGGSAALRGGPPPGSEAVEGSSRSAQKNKAKREAAKKKKEGEAEAAPTPMATPRADASAAAGDGEDTEEKVGKPSLTLPRRPRPTAHSTTKRVARARRTRTPHARAPLRRECRVPSAALADETVMALLCSCMPARVPTPQVSKKIRAVEKKLRQIGELKELVVRARPHTTWAACNPHVNRVQPAWAACSMRVGGAACGRVHTPLSA